MFLKSFFYTSKSRQILSSYVLKLQQIFLNILKCFSQIKYFQIQTFSSSSCEIFLQLFLSKIKPSQIDCNPFLNVLKPSWRPQIWVTSNLKHSLICC